MKHENQKYTLQGRTRMAVQAVKDRINEVSFKSDSHKSTFVRVLYGNHSSKAEKEEVLFAMGVSSDWLYTSRGSMFCR